MTIAEMHKRIDGWVDLGEPDLVNVNRKCIEKAHVILDAMVKIDTPPDLVYADGDGGFTMGWFGESPVEGKAL